MGLGDIFRIKQFKDEISRLQQQNDALVSDNQNLQSVTAQMRTQLDELGAFDYYKIQEMTEQLEKDYTDRQNQLQSDYFTIISYFVGNIFFNGSKENAWKNSVCRHADDSVAE